MNIKALIASMMGQTASDVHGSPRPPGSIQVNVTRATQGKAKPSKKAKRKAQKQSRRRNR